MIFLWPFIVVINQGSENAYEVEQSETSDEDSGKDAPQARSPRPEGGGPGMKVVQPIRDMDVLDKCYAIARAHDKHRK